MSQPSVEPILSAPSGSARTTCPPEGDSHSGWLLIARIGWVVLTLLVLTLSAIAIPSAFALRQSVCQPGAHCLSIQLSPADLRQLQQMGLSAGFLAAYKVGWNVATLLISVVLAALIFWRRSTNWMALFCAYMLVLSGGATYTNLLSEGLRTVTPAWNAPVGVLELLGLSCLLGFFLLFPRGRFVPRWTRWLVPVIILAEGHYVFFNDLTQGPNGNADQFPIDFVVFAVLIFILVGLHIYRYQRVSTYRERQQTKWVVFGFAIATLGFVVSFTLEHVLFADQVVQSSVFDTLVTSTLSFSFLLLIPISIAIAILRSRLYDIDAIINRTLVYGSLSAILALIYAGGVIGAQAVINGIAQRHSSESSPVLIVVTTLLVAALVQPLRRRLQRVIDRRFYRRKYNVEQTLAAFSATLRQEVNLSDLKRHLLTVVQQTMEPHTLSLWLRSSTDER